MTFFGRGKKDVGPFIPEWIQAADNRPLILSDGGMGLGRIAQEVAGVAGIIAGGYCTSGTVWDTAKQFHHIALTGVDAYDRAQRLNIGSCDGVIIFGKDLRSGPTDLLITTAKERHRPFIVVADFTNHSMLTRWLYQARYEHRKITRLAITGYCHVIDDDPLRALLTRVYGNWLAILKPDAVALPIDQVSGPDGHAGPEGEVIS